MAEGYFLVLRLLRSLHEERGRTEPSRRPPSPAHKSPFSNLSHLQAAPFNLALSLRNANGAPKNGQISRSPRTRQQGASERAVAKKKVSTAEILSGRLYVLAWVAEQSNMMCGLLSVRRSNLADKGRGASYKPDMDLSTSCRCSVVQPPYPVFMLTIKAFIGYYIKWIWFRFTAHNNDDLCRVLTTNVFLKIHY